MDGSSFPGYPLFVSQRVESRIRDVFERGDLPGETSR
jgi:hypothetical protein